MIAMDREIKLGRVVTGVSRICIWYGVAAAHFSIVPAATLFPLVSTPLNGTGLTDATRETYTPDGWRVEWTV